MNKIKRNRFVYNLFTINIPGIRIRHILTENAIRFKISNWKFINNGSDNRFPELGRPIVSKLSKRTRKLFFSNLTDPNPSYIYLFSK